MKRLFSSACVCSVIWLAACSSDDAAPNAAGGGGSSSGGAAGNSQAGSSAGTAGASGAGATGGSGGNGGSSGSGGSGGSSGSSGGSGGSAGAGGSTGGAGGGGLDAGQGGSAGTTGGAGGGAGSDAGQGGTQQSDAAAEAAPSGDAGTCPGAGMALEFAGDMHTRVIAKVDGLPIGSASRTVEMWIYSVHDTWKAERHLYQYGPSNPKEAAFGMDFGDGPYPQMNPYDNGQADFFFNVPKATVMETGWFHLAQVYNGETNTFTAVINGVTTGTKTVTTPLKTANTDLSIGFSPTFSGNFGFTGRIDEFRIWSVARSDADIKGSMNKRLTGTETGLVTYFHFDEGTGTTSKDVVKQAVATLQTNAPPKWVKSDVMLDCK